MKCLQQDAERAESLDALLGLEGNAARLYFQNFAGMLKAGRGGRVRRVGTARGERRESRATAAGLAALDSASSPLSAFLSTSPAATVVRRGIRSMPCCRWRTVCWPRT